MTPGKVSFINSNNFFTTVLRKFQLDFKNLGYCPTIYIMFEATTALFSFPFLSSTKLKSVYDKIHKNFIKYK